MPGGDMALQKYNARDVDFQIEDFLVPGTWITIGGLNTFSRGHEEETTDTTTFASQGQAESQKMQIGKQLTLEGPRLRDSITAAGDPGQAKVEALAERLGEDSLGRMRFSHKNETPWTVGLGRDGHSLRCRDDGGEAVTARKTQSWEDFKREVFGKETEVIAGVTVRVPTDLPLGYEDRVADLSDLDGSSKLEEFADLVTPLFGEGIFEQWIDAGMGQIEFLTAITWGMAQASRKPMTFSEAYELVNSDAAGKAPNRAAR